MIVNKSKIRVTLLYIYVFYLVYTPIFAKGIFFNPYFILPVLLVVLLLPYFIKKDKSIYNLFLDKKILIFSGLILLSSLYFSIVSIINIDKLPSFIDLRIIQNNIPIIYLGHILVVIDKFQKLGYSKIDSIKFLLRIGVFYGIIAVLMSIIPDFHKFALDLYYLDRPENIYVSASRVYGLSSDYTFATPIYHGILAGSALLYSVIGNSKQLLIYIPFILAAIFLNGGTGLVVFGLFCVVSIFYILVFGSNNTKDRLKKSLMLVMGVLITLTTMRFIAPSSYRYLDNSIESTRVLIFEGHLEDNYSKLMDEGLYFPDGFSFVFGEGHRVYGDNAELFGYKNSSDIGYVNDLFMGGIVYVLLLYGAYVFYIIKSFDFRNKFYIIYAITLFLSLAVANYKGEIFKSGIIIFIMLFIPSFVALCQNNERYSIKNMDFFAKNSIGLISVIVPIYNVEKYLNQCIQSIINQTYKNIEIILIDDGSTDSSGKIADCYAKIDNRIIVYHKKNYGVSSARNEGLKNAKGNFVTFVDADDLIKPNMIERLGEFILLNRADIAICSTQTFFESKNPVMNCEINSEETIFQGNEALINMLYQKIITNALHGKMYERSLFKNIKFSEDLTIGEDLYINYQLLSISQKVVYTSQKMYLYMHRSGSAINSASYIKRIKLIERLLSIKQKDSVKRALNNRIFMEAVFCYLNIGKTKIEKADYNMLYKTVRNLRKDVIFDYNSRFVYKLYALISFCGLRYVTFLNRIKSLVQ